MVTQDFFHTVVLCLAVVVRDDPIVGIVCCCHARMVADRFGSNGGSIRNPHSSEIVEERFNVGIQFGLRTEIAQHEFPKPRPKIDWKEENLTKPGVELSEVRVGLQDSSSSNVIKPLSDGVGDMETAQTRL